MFINFFENKLNRCFNNLIKIIDFDIDRKYNFVDKNKKIATVVRNFRIQNSSID